MSDLPTAVIVDVDGTLCDVRTVRHHVIRKPKNPGRHRPHGGMARTHNATVWPASCASSAYWMASGWGWHCAAPEWKAWKFHDEVAKYFRIVGAIDDNPDIVSLWVSLGIETRVMPGWHDPADPLLTESAGWSRCVDCAAEIEPGEPCVDLRNGKGDIACCVCADERGLM